MNLKNTRLLGLSGDLVCVLCMSHPVAAINLRHHRDHTIKLFLMSSQIIPLLTVRFSPKKVTSILEFQRLLQRLF